jgi:hypothetical protein
MADFVEFFAVFFVLGPWVVMYNFFTQELPL